MTDVYLGLGTNLGDRRANLRQARRLLAQIPGVTLLRASLVYETQPVGGVSQDDYLNQVVVIATTLAPMALLRRLQALELALHRRRIQRWGARCIDLDLLVYGGVVLQTPALTLPHPQLANRRFVLVPLLEVARGPLVATVVRMLNDTPDHNWVRPYFEK